MKQLNHGGNSIVRIHFYVSETVPFHPFGRFPDFSRVGTFRGESKIKIVKMEALEN